MKIAIAASAVQLTFGLETWDLSYFEQILVYPTEYKNPQTGRLHKGETNLGGFMCFSWKDFEAGNANPTDKINLGLHEFAHALRFNGVRGHDSDYFFKHYFSKWMVCATREFVNLQNNKPSILRKYGGANINEFFSVTIETFFEQPLELKQSLPELFLQTSILLNQSFNNDGSLWLNCREQLLKATNGSLSKSYNQVLSFHLKRNLTAKFCFGISVLGLVSLAFSEFQSSFGYFCLLLALGLWFIVELKYTRIYFEKDSLQIHKGFWFLKNRKSFSVPIKNLVSFVSSYERKNSQGFDSVLQVGYVTITYYENSFFHEEIIHCDLNFPEFDQLAQELRKNYVLVFVVKE